jgi:hypothetical protein
LVFCFNVINVNLAQPNQPGLASSARIGLWIEPGYLLQEMQARLRLIGCVDHACYDDRVAPRPSEAESNP